MTIEDKLRSHATYSPEKIALKCEGKSYSYSALFKAACLKSTELGDVTRKMVPIVATSTFDFIASYFAIHLADAVAVPLDKELPSCNEWRNILLWSGGM